MSADSTGMRDQQTEGGVYLKALKIVGALWILYHFLYISGFFIRLGVPVSPYLHSPMHLGGFLFFAYLLVRAKKGMRQKYPPWYDIILAILCVIPPVYYGVYVAPRLDMLAARVSLEYAIMGWFLILAVLEMVRRAYGYVFLGVLVVFLVYALTARSWPGFMCGLQLPFKMLGSWILVSEDGMLGGYTLYISATVIVAFLFFGAVLTVSGAAKSLTDGALALMGRFRGGPAKIAVVASAFLGMLTGSSISNVMTTGVITIPLMKRTGFSANFAGAVEAVASNGGMLMPPIMGAVIFIMVSFTGIPYTTIMIASFIPAFLYFWAVFLSVDFEAVKRGLKGLPPSELPSPRNTIKVGWFYILPLALLLYLLIEVRMAPQKAALWSLVALLVVVAFRKETRVGIKKLVDASWEAIRGMLLVIPGIAAAGILIVCLTVTGLGSTLAIGIIDITGGNVYLILLLAAVVAYILGMGTSLIPIYLVLATLIAPALVQAGVPTIAAHLFVIWFAVTFFITPPVAPCIFAACAISGGNTLKTGLQAMRLAGPIYILPFAFALGPAMLLIGSTGEIVRAIVSAFVGVSALASGLSGWLLTRTSGPERILLIAGAILMIVPGWTLDLIGLGLIVAAVIINFIAFRTAKGRVRTGDAA